MTQKKKQEIPAWEWAVAAVGLAIVLAAIGFFALSGLREKSPPRFALVVDSVAGAHVAFTVRNEGDVTAAELVVEGVAAGQPPAQVVLDFVPPRSRRSAVLIFDSAPAGAVRLRARSYLVP